MGSVRRFIFGPTLRSIVAWACFGPASLAVLSGCGSSNDAPRKVTVYEVKGKLLLPDGKPLSGGHVYFVPTDGALAPEAKVGADGSFSLVTANSGEGAPPGDYKVRVEPADPSLISPRRPTAARKLPFPPKYLDEDSSGLKVTIKAEPNTLQPIQLK
jgi:hypothetical protein